MATLHDVVAALALELTNQGFCAIPEYHGTVSLTLFSDTPSQNYIIHPHLAHSCRQFIMNLWFYDDMVVETNTHLNDQHRFNLIDVNAIQQLLEYITETAARHLPQSIS